MKTPRHNGPYAARGVNVILHSCDAGRTACSRRMVSTTETSRKPRCAGSNRHTHKSVTSCHCLCVRLPFVHREIEIEDEGGNGRTEYDLCLVSARACASAGSEWHQVLRHPVGVWVRTLSYCKDEQKTTRTAASAPCLLRHR